VFVGGVAGWLQAVPNVATWAQRTAVRE